MFGDILRKALTILPRIAIDAADFGKLLPVRLADVKDVGRAKSDSR